MTTIIIVYILSISLILFQSLANFLFKKFKQSNFIRELREINQDGIADEYNRIFGIKGNYGYKSISDIFRGENLLWKIIKCKDKSRVLNIYILFLIINRICIFIYCVLVLFIVVYYFLVVQYN